MSAGKLTTHVLDIVNGRGAANMRVDLQRGGAALASITLDDGGRGTLLTELQEGIHELQFHAAEYQGIDFYDIITIRFYVSDIFQHYHIPLILSPYGYSTYRGG